MTLSFRRLEMADAPRYRVARLEGLRLASRAFQSTLDEESQLTLDDYAKRLAHPKNATIGAFANGELVGIGTVLTESRTRTRHKGEIVGMYVTPAARGTGAAAGIMERLIAHARSVGLRALLLTVASENTRAQRLYARWGFRAYGQEPRAQLHDGEYIDTTLMSLLLE
jgi:RimJ/RimL family protein N-acetyltransferase